MILKYKKKKLKNNTSNGKPSDGALPDIRFPTIFNSKSLQNVIIT